MASEPINARARPVGPTTPLTIEVGRARLDVATILGLALGLLLLFGALAVGGTIDAFLNMPSVLIVLGGTFAVTMISFSFREIIRVQRVLAKTVFHTLPDPGDAARMMLHLADRARRNGALDLQRSLPLLDGAPFLQRCIEMIVDGAGSEELESVMRQELDATVRRHTRSASVLRKAAETAPAMGLIGTLIGLVQMLGKLEDPGAIGPGMAVALLTTFYGAILSYMVFSPLASKLERNCGEESLINTVYLLGAAAIVKQENPRRLQVVLNTVLPPSKSVSTYA